MVSNVLSPASDETLVLRAKAGDQKALNLLIRRSRPTVEKISARFFGFAMEPDDILQEGMLALLSAVYAFLPEKNASFRTFAAVCVANRLKTAVRQAASPKNAPLNAYVPLDEVEIADDGDPVNKLLSEEATAEIYSIFQNDLSSLELSVLKHFLNGYSYRETASALHITEKAADNALQRARAKLKRAINQGS